MERLPAPPPTNPGQQQQQQQRPPQHTPFPVPHAPPPPPQYLQAAQLPIPPGSPYSAAVYQGYPIPATTGSQFPFGNLQPPPVPLQHVYQQPPAPVPMLIPPHVNTPAPLGYVQQQEQPPLPAGPAPPQDQPLVLGNLLAAIFKTLLWEKQSSSHIAATEDEIEQKMRNMAPTKDIHSVLNSQHLHAVAEHIYRAIVASRALGTLLDNLAALQGQYFRHQALNIRFANPYGGWVRRPDRFGWGPIVAVQIGWCEIRNLSISVINGEWVVTFHFVPRT